MKRHLLLAAVAGISVTAAMGASAMEYIPEPPKSQSASYDDARNVVVVTATAPTHTEYDWESYVQYELPYISYILVERHLPGTYWDDDAEIGRVENPEPGKVFTFTDTEVLPDTKYEYRLTCYVDQTKGQYSCFTSVYTGVTPGALNGFKASVADHLATTVDFEVTAPETSVSGAPLTANCSIELQEYLDFTYTTIHTFENVAPGETRTWQLADRQLNTSLHYRAFARMGSAGNGEATEADVYVGLDKPGQPVDFLCVAEGEGVRLTWAHAPVGARGGNFNPEETYYDIYRIYNDGTRERVDAGVEGTEYFDNPGFDEACTASYSIIGVNEAGEGLKEAVHPAISFGKPARLPFTESFAGQKMEHRGWMLETTQDDEYYTYQAWEFPEYGRMFYFVDDSYLDIPAQDNDGGIASCKFYGYSPDGQTESLISPAIDTTGAQTFDLSFYYYEVCAEASANSVAVAVSRDGGEWEEMLSTTAPESAEPGWKLVEVPVTLDKKCASLRFRIDAIRHDGPITNMYVDNIRAEADKSGVDAIITDAATEGVTEYYTIQGVRLPAMPEAPGVYILRDGKAVSKVVVR